MATPKDKEIVTMTVEYTDPTTGEILQLTPADLALRQAAEDLAAYAQDQGGGFENQTRDDVAVPWIVILQPGSPEVQGEDAIGKSGQIINKTTAEIFTAKDGLDFVPATTLHKMVEWKPKNPDGSGGGYVATHDHESPLSVKVRSTQPLGKYKHPENGNDLVETYYVYGLVVNRADSTYYPAVMAFPSTFIKPYQNWMFTARSIMIQLPNGGKVNPPLWAHKYTIRTDKVVKGSHTWYIPKVSFAGADAASSRLSASSDIYKQARDIKDAVNAGDLVADDSALSRDSAVQTDDAPKQGDTSAADAPY